MTTDPYGPRIDRDGGETTRLTGAMVTNLIAAVEEILGAAALRGALERIPAEPRRDLEEALPISQVPIRSCEYLIHALADETGRDVYGLNLEINRRATRRTFSTLWQVVLRFATIDRLFAGAERHFERTYDRGRLEAERVSPNAGRLRVRGRPGMSRLSREGFAEGVCTLVRMAGYRGVEAESGGHVDGADVSLRWRA